MLVDRLRTDAFQAIAIGIGYPNLSRETIPTLGLNTDDNAILMHYAANRWPSHLDDLLFDDVFEPLSQRLRQQLAITFRK